MTIFVSTAYLDEAERCRRVGLLHQGKFLAVGSPEEVRSLFRGALLEIRCGDPRRAAAALRQAFPADAVGLFGDRVHLGTRDPVLPVAAAETALAAAGVPFESVLPIPPSLEDVFISVLGQGGGGGA